LVSDEEGEGGRTQVLHLVAGFPEPYSPEVAEGAKDGGHLACWEQLSWKKHTGMVQLERCRKQECQDNCCLELAPNLLVHFTASRFHCGHKHS
jgi:hypothetical protein